jgi:hypothetical protein
MRKQDIVAHSGREYNYINQDKGKIIYLPRMLGSIGNATVHYNFSFFAMYVAQDSAK